MFFYSTFTTRPFTTKLRNPQKAKSSRKKDKASPSTPPAATTPTSTPITSPINASPLVAQQTAPPTGSAAHRSESKESSGRDDEEEWEDEVPGAQTAQPSSKFFNSAPPAPTTTLSGLTIEQLAEHIGEVHVATHRREQQSFGQRHGQGANGHVKCTVRKQKESNEPFFENVVFERTRTWFNTNPEALRSAYAEAICSHLRRALNLRCQAGYSRIVVHLE